MKRKRLESLLEWKESKCKKPFLLNGTKGVGKTYLIFDFSKLYYLNTIYLNFERDPNITVLFQENDYKQVLNNIQTYKNCSFQEKSTILILDEITYCPNIVSFLSQYKNCKDSDSWQLICIQSTSFYNYDIKTEEEIQSLCISSTLYPFDFEEFLWAIGHEWYAEVIREHYNSNKKVPDIVHKELLDLLELYLGIGGMPRVINEYIQFESFANVLEQQHYLIENIYTDAVNILGESNGLKVRNILQTFNQQLCKKNKKFQYNLIRKGASQAQYEEALQYLVQNHILIPSYKLDSDSVILYLYDVGLLNTLTRQLITETVGEEVRKESRKGVIDNYIGMQLRINYKTLSFWESNATAKINFIVLGKVPIESSVDHNTRSKSLSIFKQKYNVEHSIKLSTKNFGTRYGVKYVPLYAAFCI